MPHFTVIVPFKLILFTVHNINNLVYVFYFLFSSVGVACGCVKIFVLLDVCFYQHWSFLSTTSHPSNSHSHQSNNLIWRWLEMASISLMFVWPRLHLHPMVTVIGCTMLEHKSDGHTGPLNANSKAGPVFWFHFPTKNILVKYICWNADGRKRSPYVILAVYHVTQCSISPPKNDLWLQESCLLTQFPSLRAASFRAVSPVLLLWLVVAGLSNCIQRLWWGIRISTHRNPILF